MAFSVLLESAKKRPGEKDYNFTLHFNPPIYLHEGQEYKAAINELIIMTYSCFNFAAAHDNSQIKWREQNRSGVENRDIPRRNIRLPGFERLPARIGGASESK